VKSVEQCDVNADEKNCAEGCTRLPDDGDSTGSSAVAKFPPSGAAVGRIFPAGDADIFALEILPDQKLRLSVVDPTLAPDCADGRLDSQLELFDGEGALVAFNDDAPASAATKGYCSELVLDKPGFYTVRVRSSQHSSPAQVFSYKLVAAPPVSDDLRRAARSARALCVGRGQGWGPSRHSDVGADQDGRVMGRLSRSARKIQAPGWVPMAASRRGWGTSSALA
jgi:hypothetical protein